MIAVEGVTYINKGKVTFTICPTIGAHQLFIAYI